MNLTPTRRAILAGATAAGAMTGAAAGIAIATATTAAAEPDPVFDLIERHRAAYRAHGEAIKITDAAESGSAEEDAAELQQGEACDAEWDILRALVLTVPTTFAGAAAMLRYLVELIELGNYPLGARMSRDTDDHSCTQDALLATLVKFMEARA